MDKEIRTYYLVIFFIFCFMNGYIFSEDKIYSSPDISSVWQAYRKAMIKDDFMLYQQGLSALKDMGIITAQKNFYAQKIEDYVLFLMSWVTVFGMQILFLLSMVFIICMLSKCLLYRRMLFLLCMITLIISGVSLVYAYIFIAEKRILVTEKKVVYNGPGKQFCIQTTLEKYSECLVSKKQDGWIKIKHNSIIGWLDIHHVVFELSDADPIQKGICHKI